MSRGTRADSSRVDKKVSFGQSFEDLEEFGRQFYLCIRRITKLVLKCIRVAE